MCRCPPDNVEGKHLKKAGIDAGMGGEEGYALRATVLVPLLETFLPEPSPRRRVFRGTQNVQRVTDDQSAALSPSTDQK